MNSSNFDIGIYFYDNRNFEPLSFDVNEYLSIYIDNAELIN